MKNKISLFSLILLIVAAIGSIRTLPTTALFGGHLVIYFLLAAAFFLIPVALVSAEFSSRFPEEGGVFYWIRSAFGEKVAVLAVWLQWINTMVWYPTMLLFTAGTAAYLIDPVLAQSKIFLLFTGLAIFWGLTWINLRGIQVSAKLNAFCATVGTLIPMGFLIALGILWGVNQKEIALSFSLKGFDFFGQGSALVTIMASLVGMELAGVYVGDIENPQRNFPKAIAVSILILLATLILGALSIAMVIPAGDIQFVDGIMQTFTLFLNAFNLSGLVPILALLIILGAVGGSVNWLLSPAKGLLQAAEHGFLPAYFTKTNRGGISVRILTLQAILVSLFCFGMQLLESLNTFYWLLLAVATGLYMLMYILLFLSALKLGRPSEGYQIPRGMRKISCFAGIIAALFTIGAGFEPSPGLVIENTFTYAGLIALGFIAFLSPVLLLWRYKKMRARLEAVSR